MSHITQEQFLSYFGSPALRIRPEQGREDDIPQEHRINWTQWNSSDILLSANENYPYCLEFTPNGNFSDWCRENNKVTPKMKDWKGWNCLFVDIDLKDWKWHTMESLKDVVLQKCLSHKIPYTFLVTSWQWYHVYWVIKEDERTSSYDWEIPKVLEYLAMLFWWDTSACNIQRWMRLPGSYHWKWEKKQTYVEFQDVLLTKEVIDIAVKYVEEQQRVITKDTVIKTYGAVLYDDINKIPIPDIIDKLSKYPKNNYFPILINDTEIAIWYTNGKRVPTHWWKYNKEKNYVNNFTTHHYSIYERPRWWVYQFIYYWFDGNQIRVAEFLNKEYNINILKHAEKDWEVAHQVFEEGGESMVICTNKRVILQTIHEKWKREKVVIKNNVIVKGVYEYKNTDGNNEKGILAEIDWTKAMLPYYTTKKKWNEKLWKIGIHRFWEDDECADFHRIVTESTSISLKKAALHNGIYKDYVMLWWQLIIWNDEEIFPLPRSTFQLFSWERCTVKEYYDMLSQIFDPVISAPAFLQTLALAAMNIWSDAAVANCYPALLLTWTTRTWKTTLRKMLKQAVWYSEDARTLSLPDITPKPLRELAVDSAILSLEELTGNVRPWTEELLRNIVNHEEWRMGTIWDTIVYSFSAPLFVCWERWFKDESLRNRFVTCCMLEKYKIGNVRKIKKISKYTCSQEVYETFFQKNEDIVEKKIERQEKLEWLKMDARTAEVYSYIFVMNDVFNVWIEEETLLWYVKKNIQLSSENEEHYNNEEKPELILKQIMTEWQMKWLVSITYYPDVNMYECFFDSWYKNKNLINLNKMFAWFKEHETDGNNRLVFWGSSLQIRILQTNAIPLDHVLNKIMEEVYHMKDWYRKRMYHG